MVEQKNTNRPNGTDTINKSTASILRERNFQRTNAARANTSTQKPVKKYSDRRVVERQAKEKAQEALRREQDARRREAERKYLEEARERLAKQKQAELKKKQKEQEKELAKKANRVVKSKQSHYHVSKKKSNKGISKLKIKKAMGTLFTLAVLGISGITIYKSGLIQTMYSDYLTNKMLKEAQANTDTTTLIDEPVVIIPEEEEVPEEEEIVEEKHEVINTDMYDAGYEFNPDITPEFLQNLNPALSDNCAWLEIPGTKINYAFVHPSVYCVDNVDGFRNEIKGSGMSPWNYMAGYFLHNDITLHQSTRGTLFLDISDNSLSNHMEDLTDVNTIYGHHMADGTMFNALMNWKTDKNGTYNEAHPFALIYTDDGYAYKVTFIASRIIDGASNSNALHNYNFNSYEEKCEYIQGIMDEAHANNWFALDDYEVKEDDKFMSFVTCTYERTNARFQLIGVMQKIKVRDTSLTDDQNGYYVEENSSQLYR